MSWPPVTIIILLQFRLSVSQYLPCISVHDYCMQSSISVLACSDWEK